VIQVDTLQNKIAFSEEDLEILVTVAMQASLAIQRLDLIDEALKNRKIRDDLKLAHEVQQAFLPQHRPDFPDYEFYSFYRANNQVGGDYYDYISMGENRVAIIVADVVGHGVAAALLMAKVAAEARFALASTGCVTKAIHGMNNSLSGLNLDRFVTLLMGCLDRDTHTFTYVNAGHLPPMCRRLNGEIALINGHSSLPIGINPEATYESTTIELSDGDVVIMFTDGINDSMDEKGNQLGIPKLIDDVRDSQTKTPTAIGKEICQSVNRHLGPLTPLDDICLVCFGRRKPEPKTI
jgi:serine phosphatase RsbU (regulator of sigma subunit)